MRFLCVLTRKRFNLFTLRHVSTVAPVSANDHKAKNEIYHLAQYAQLDSKFSQNVHSTAGVSTVVQNMCRLLSSYNVPTGHIDPKVSTKNSLEMFNQALHDHGHLFDTDSLIEVFYSLYKFRLNEPIFDSIIELLEPRVCNMSVESFCKFMFILGLHRSKMSLKLINSTEKIFENNLNSMSIEQIALCCYGYFRTQSRPSHERIALRITEMILTNKLQGNPIYSIILKFLRFADIKETSSKFRYLYGNITQDQISDIKSLPTFLHLLKLGEKTFIYNKHVLEGTLNLLLKEEPSFVRLKDLAEILRCCNCFGYKASQDVIEYLTNFSLPDEEINTYPAFYVSLVTHLAYLGIIRHDLVENILNNLSELSQLPTTVNYSINMQLLQLDTILNIRHHEKYKGRLLDGPKIQKLRQRYKFTSEDEIKHCPPSHRAIKTFSTMKKLYEHAKDAFGDRVFLHPIFPYSINPDVCVANDVRQIKSITNAPIAPNSVSGCTVFVVRQGVHYGDWRCTVYRNQFRAREELLAEMGFNVRTFFWADIEVALSNLFLKEVAANVSLTKQLTVYSKLFS